jgi:hypothetical protein
MTREPATKELRLFEAGLMKATLEQGMRWERLGLGRVVFEAGRATWYGTGQASAAERRAALGAA